MLAMILATLATPTPAVSIPAGNALVSIIAAKDEELFTLYFDGCDPERMRTMVTADLEFYHDRGGFDPRSGDQFVDQYRDECQKREKPDAWRMRRELVKSTFQVDPVPGYGAMETGEHLFYERQGDGPEMLTTSAKFAHLWVLTPEGWRISRVFSYAHRKIGKR